MWSLGLNNSARLIANISFIPVAIICSGCASKQTDFRWVNPVVVSDYSNISRTNRDDWAKKISNLPIELHGQLSDNANTKALAITENVIPDDVANSAHDKEAVISQQQRLVLYTDDANAPEARDFCAVEKHARTSSDAREEAALRIAVCDGSEMIAYARESGCADTNSCDMASRIAHLKKSLIAALYPAPTLKQMRDIGPEAGW